MSALAACRFGDFFNVTVASSGNWDQALFWNGRGERYHGLYDEELYARQAVKTYAAGLRGKVLITHGLRDAGCHPGPLFQLLQALIDANKDFDLVILPTAAHELPPYGVRKRLDHFVRHLLGGEPDTGFEFRTSAQGTAERLKVNAVPPDRE
jgi:dipeptidyl aminopeptidase/acylaminoacyl peptidase